MRNVRSILIIVAATIAANQFALAKTDKFKRPGSTQGVSTDAATKDTGTPPKAGSSPAQKSDSPGAAMPASGTSSGEKKVDLSDLENRYWTAKDTEFNVVQNRLYTKAKKFSFTLTTGPLLTDIYTNSWNVGGAFNYYFSERMGVELQGWKTSAADADFVSTFATQKGAFIDHNMPQGYIGASFNWIPIYAKMSLLEKKILYFDLSISPGIGVTLLNSVTFVNGTSPVAPPQTSGAPLTFALDLAEQVFLSEHWAIRVDARNHFYSEQIYSASTGSSLRTKSTYYGTILLGVTFFQ